MDSKKNGQGIITESPIKNLCKKSCYGKKKNSGLLIILIIIIISPHAGQSEQHWGWAAESKLRWRYLWKKDRSDLSQILTSVSIHEYYWNPKV